MREANNAIIELCKLDSNVNVNVIVMMMWREEKEDEEKGGKRLMLKQLKKKNWREKREKYYDPRAYCELFVITICHAIKAKQMIEYVFSRKRFMIWLCRHKRWINV